MHYSTHNNKISILLLTLAIAGCSDDSDNKKYSSADWEVYEGCKARVYDKIENNYIYSACKEMLSHKSALRKYGASHSYRYWINRLNSN